jgi:hypothetical protein
MHNTLRKRFLNSYSDNRKSKIENLKWLGGFAIVVTLALCGAVATAQQARKIFRIGYLESSTASGSAVLLEAFRQELSKLRMDRGKEYRFRVPICRAKE